MTVTVIALKADKREKTGKGPARALRRAGKVPAIIYGKGEKEVMIAVDAREITLQYKKESFMSQLMDIEIGKEKLRVIPRAVQLHPVTDEIEHADFVHLTKDAKIHVTVKVHFLNEEKCLGIKRGGVLNIVRREIEFLCNPENIPDAIEIDTTNLNIGDSVHIDDVKLPEGVRPVIDRNFTIIAVAGRGGKKDETAGGEEAAGAPAAEAKK